MKKCTVCKIEKRFEEFYRRQRSKDGYSSACKVCGAQQTERSRLKRPDKGQTSRRAFQKVSAEQAFAWKARQGCLACREQAPCCLELHHLDADAKDGNPSAYARAGFNRFLHEAKKCIVLCSNCHKKIHANMLEIDEQIILAWQSETWSGSSVGRAAV